MSECLLYGAGELRVDNKEIPWEELISSDSLLAELAVSFRRRGWPSRTPQEIRQELLRMRAKYDKKVVLGKFMNEGERLYFSKHPSTWVTESEDEDDIFMPIGALSAKIKSAASSKSKGAASSKGKSAASSKGKSAASSKGKSGASMEPGGCIDGR